MYPNQVLFLSVNLPFIGTTYLLLRKQSDDRFLIFISKSIKKPCRNSLRLYVLLNYEQNTILRLSYKAFTSFNSTKTTFSPPFFIYVLPWCYLRYILLAKKVQAYNMGLQNMVSVISPIGAGGKQSIRRSR